MGPRLSNYSLFASAVTQGVSMGLAYALVNKFVLLPHAKAYTDSKVSILDSRLRQVEKAQHREEALIQQDSSIQNKVRRG